MSRFTVVGCSRSRSVQNASSLAATTKHQKVKHACAKFRESGTERPLALSCCLSRTERGVGLGCLDVNDPICSLKSARQGVVIRQGIDTDTAKRVIKTIKGAKLKVHAVIQGDQKRVIGKNAMIFNKRFRSCGKPIWDFRYSSSISEIELRGSVQCRVFHQSCSVWGPCPW